MYGEIERLLDPRTGPEADEPKSPEASVGSIFFRGLNSYNGPRPFRRASPKILYKGEETSGYLNSPHWKKDDYNYYIVLALILKSNFQILLTWRVLTSLKPGWFSSIGEFLGDNPSISDNDVGWSKSKFCNDKVGSASIQGAVWTPCNDILSALDVFPIISKLLWKILKKVNNCS